MGRKKKENKPEAVEIQNTFSEVDLDFLLEEGEGEIENVYSANDKAREGEQELHND